MSDLIYEAESYIPGISIEWEEISLERQELREEIIESHKKNIYAKMETIEYHFIFEFNKLFIS